MKRDFFGQPQLNVSSSTLYGELLVETKQSIFDPGTFLLWKANSSNTIRKCLFSMVPYKFSSDKSIIC